MYPLDFEEFIRNVGVGDSVVESVRKAWLDRTSVDSFVHAKMMELYRLYLVVGGMPDAVRQYLETNNLQTVIRIQRDIINLYKRDISKYDSGNKLYIEEIFNLIPPELNAKNKRFVLKNLNENAKFSRLQNSFLWLTDAGVALPVYNVEEPKFRCCFRGRAIYSSYFKVMWGCSPHNMLKASSCALLKGEATSIMARSMRMPWRRN